MVSSVKTIIKPKQIKQIQVQAYETKRNFYAVVYFQNAFFGWDLILETKNPMENGRTQPWTVFTGVLRIINHGTIRMTDSWELYMN